MKIFYDLETCCYMIHVVVLHANIHIEVAGMVWKVIKTRKIHVFSTFIFVLPMKNEPLHQKTNNLHRQKQRRRSAVQ